MVPETIAPPAPPGTPSPERPVFLVTTSTPYRWVRDGRVVRMDSIDPGHPVLVRARFCGSPCGPGTLRRCDEPPVTPFGTSCLFLYGGPFNAGSFEAVRAVLKMFAKSMVSIPDFERNDPQVTIRDWQVLGVERLPLLYNGQGSRWPHREFRWWWAPRTEGAAGRWQATMTGKRVEGGQTAWDADVRAV